MENYPYFILPYLEEYRQVDPNSEKGKKLCRLLALNIGNRAALRRVLGMEPPQIDNYVEEETKTPSTFDTIDTFLAKYQGHGVKITESPVKNGENESRNTESDERNILKDLVKSGRYKEAIDFIESQNLINPKKNIYFADQIRFLKKLMELQQLKNK